MKNKSYKVEEPGENKIPTMPKNTFSSFSQSVCTTIVNGKVVEKKGKQVSYDGKNVKVKEVDNEKVVDFEYDEPNMFNLIADMSNPFDSFDKIFGANSLFSNNMEKIKSIKNKK